MYNALLLIIWFIPYDEPLNLFLSLNSDEDIF